MSFETFRQLNIVLSLAAFGWLMLRTRQAWHADWAKPDHVLHYRALLGVVAIFVFLAGFGSTIHEHLHSRATFVSPLYTIANLGVIALCAWWPKRARRKP